MGYSQNIPDPCRTCQVMQKHGCQMQGICTKVKASYRRAIVCQLNGQAVERAYRLQKRYSRKYKGGAM